MGRFWRALSFIFVIKPLPIMEKDRASLSSADEHGEQGEPLIEDSSESGFPQSRQSGRRFPRLLVVSCPLLVALVSLSLLLGLTLIAVSFLRDHPAALQQQQRYHVSRIMVKPCGETPDEARKNGCHFDVISFCWLPSECYDAELSQDFYDANQLEWFLDPNRTQPLTHEQIMTGEYTGLYVNWEYHLRHCTAMWKKLHRAVLGDMGRRAVDGYIGNYEHTKHCEHMLLGDRGIAWDTINTRIAVKYPDCGI